MFKNSSKILLLVLLVNSIFSATLYGDKNIGTKNVGDTTGNADSDCEKFAKNDIGLTMTIDCENVNTGFVQCEGSKGAGNNAYKYYAIIKYTLKLSSSADQPSTCCCMWGNARRLIV